MILLQLETQPDISFRTADLLAGQLAEAAIAGFDSSVKPNGIGWFIV